MQLIPHFTSSNSFFILLSNFFIFIFLKLLALHRMGYQLVMWIHTFLVSVFNFSNHIKTHKPTLWEKALARNKFTLEAIVTFCNHFLKLVSIPSPASAIPFHPTIPNKNVFSAISYYSFIKAHF